MIKICVVCKKKYEGYGHNASPFAIGRCCDICNIKIIIPFRLRGSYGIS